MEYFQLRHARIMLDHIDKRIGAKNKFNVLVTNFNVVLSGCLLIEVLEITGQKFEPLKIRCKAIRDKIENIV